MPASGMLEGTGGSCAGSSCPSPSSRHLVPLTKWDEILTTSLGLFQNMRTWLQGLGFELPANIDGGMCMESPMVTSALVAAKSNKLSWGIRVLQALVIFNWETGGQQLCKTRVKFQVYRSVFLCIIIIIIYILLGKLLSYLLQKPKSVIGDAITCMYHI